MLCQSLPNYIFHYSFTVLFNKHGTSVAKQRSQKKTNSLEITSPVEQIITALELRNMLSQVRARAAIPLMSSKNHLKNPKLPVTESLCYSPRISSWSFSSWQLSLALEDNLPRAASNSSMSSSEFLHPPEIKGASACAWVFWEAEIKYSIQYLHLPKGFVQIEYLKTLKAATFLPVMLETQYSQIWNKSEGSCGCEHCDKWTGTKEGVDHTMRFLSLLFVLNNGKYKVPCKSKCSWIDNHRLQTLGK